MEPVHLQILRAAHRIAGRDWTFSIADLIQSLVHLNAGTVRTHVSSRCCVDVPSNHASRYRYFRSVARGIYRIEPAFRGNRSRAARQATWQDRLLAAMPPSIDPSLVAQSLTMTPTERLETMRRAAQSLDAMTHR